MKYFLKRNKLSKKAELRLEDIGFLSSYPWVKFEKSDLGGIILV